MVLIQSEVGVVPTCPPLHQAVLMGQRRVNSNPAPRPSVPDWRLAKLYTVRLGLCSSGSLFMTLPDSRSRVQCPSCAHSAMDRLLSVLTSCECASLMCCLQSWSRSVRSVRHKNTSFSFPRMFCAALRGKKPDSWTLIMRSVQRSWQREGPHVLTMLASMAIYLQQMF